MFVSSQRTVYIMFLQSFSDFSLVILESVFLAYIFSNSFNFR